MSSLGDRITKKEIDVMVKKVDADNDGFINCKDTRDFLKQKVKINVLNLQRVVPCSVLWKGRRKENRYLGNKESQRKVWSKH